MIAGDAIPATSRCSTSRSLAVCDATSAIQHTRVKRLRGGKRYNSRHRSERYHRISAIKSRLNRIDKLRPVERRELTAADRAELARVVEPSAWRCGVEAGVSSWGRAAPDCGGRRSLGWPHPRLLHGKQGRGRLAKP